MGVIIAGPAGRKSITPTPGFLLQCDPLAFCTPERRPQEETPDTLPDSARMRSRAHSVLGRINGFCWPSPPYLSICDRFPSPTPSLSISSVVFYPVVAPWVIFLQHHAASTFKIFFSFSPLSGTSTSQAGRATSTGHGFQIVSGNFNPRWYAFIQPVIMPGCPIFWSPRLSLPFTRRC